MIPLTRYTYVESKYGFSVSRLVVDGAFEALPSSPSGVTDFATAIVDLGSPYAVIPPGLHQTCLKIHRDFGKKPFSSFGKLVLQRFVEVGLRFLVQRPHLHYRPNDFVRVKAFLLEPQFKGKAFLIGLETISHFALYVPPEPDTAFLLE